MKEKKPEPKQLLSGLLDTGYTFRGHRILLETVGYDDKDIEGNMKHFDRFAEKLHRSLDNED